jgi:hypothetical protein
MSRHERELRILYWTSADEWYAEIDNRRIALLTDARFEDTFWYSYSVHRLTDDPVDIEKLYKWENAEVKFRHKATEVMAPFAFPSVVYLNYDESTKERITASGRISMRSLYLMMPPLTLWERLCAKFANQKGKP